MKETTDLTRLTNHRQRILRSAFGGSLEENAPLARFTAARVGGPGDAVITAKSVDHLAEVASKLWELEFPFIVLGGGSNVLVSDKGIREVVILNRAKEIKIEAESHSVWAGSGASFGQMARRVSLKGFGGLEWAVGIPGSVGGAVYGNAGAHGGDVAGNLRVAEILHRYEGRKQWSVGQMDYTYRSSILKRDSLEGVILSARFGFTESTVYAARKLTDHFASTRKKTQPPGASMGSIFKNPPGDYAGRLIELTGLKGTRIGGAEISPVHANFFICDAGSKASDIYALIRLVQKKVVEKFGVKLALEIELIGEWEPDEN
ncbi:MAG: UDP-N-acetylmuramate dehydrogenase [Anaerolineales bacterium]|nr:UDP-N-acetylmuramate dehydrogenase [Anaerolineales bacterium]